MGWLRSLNGWLGTFSPVARKILPWAGGLLLVLGALSAAHSWMLARVQVHADATVTENVSSFAPEGGVLYYPRLRFRTKEGELEQVVSRVGTDYVRFPAGDDLPVMYPVGRPEQAEVATVRRVYFVAIVLGVLGVVLFDWGLILRLRAKGRVAG
jgi:hypothetical protein